MRLNIFCDINSSEGAKIRLNDTRIDQLVFKS